MLWLLRLPEWLLVLLFSLLFSVKGNAVYGIKCTTSNLFGTILLPNVKKARKPCLLGRNLTTLFCFVAPVTIVPFQHHVIRCKAKHFLVVQPRFLSSKHSVGETTQLCGRTF